MGRRRTFVAATRYAAILGLACALAATSVAAEIRIGGTGSAVGTMQLLAAAFKKSNPDFRLVVVPSLGSGGGIKAVAAGAVDLAVTSRVMNDAERGLGLTETEYGRTPFVFAVAAKSRAMGITRAELADIYSGKKTKWADGSQVRIVLRPTSDIDTDMVKSISPEIRQALMVAEKRPGVEFAVNDQDAANSLERIPGAVGPSSLAVILSEKRALKPLKFEGIDPTPKNAASGAYSFYKRLFFITGPKSSAEVRRFIEFIHSPAGRKILAETGHWIP